MHASFLEIIFLLYKLDNINVNAANSHNGMSASFSLARSREFFTPRWSRFSSWFDYKIHDRELFYFFILLPVLVGKHLTFVNRERAFEVWQTGGQSRRTVE